MSNPFRLISAAARNTASGVDARETSDPDPVTLTLDDGRTIQVRRVRHPRARRIKLTVDERGARVTLPLRASLVAGERFVHEHRDWLVEQLQRHVIAKQPGLQRGITDALPLRGTMLPLRWRDGRYTRLLQQDDLLSLETTARAGDAALARALRDFYEAQARADIGRWLPKYLSSLPRPPARVLLKRTASQWGSLSPDGSLSLDLSLVLARPSAFEYVLVHELCHLVHANHSRAFWRQVEARFPDWRDERTYFRAEGQRLKAALRALLAGLRQ